MNNSLINNSKGNKEKNVRTLYSLLLFYMFDYHMLKHVYKGLLIYKPSFIISCIIEAILRLTYISEFINSWISGIN